MSLSTLDSLICRHARRGWFKNCLDARKKALLGERAEKDYRIECVITSKNDSSHRPGGKCHGKRSKGRVGPMFGEAVLIILFLFVGTVSAGVDFSYLGGIATTLKRSTQQYIANIQTKNKEQAQIAYERIQQILRDLPDTARNRELMDEYFQLIEKIRATGEASLETRKRLSELTASSGAHIKTESVVRVNAH